MKEPKVSVVMLTYKRPEDLAEALPAVAKQAVELSAEVIVVDNAPDGSARTQVETTASQFPTGVVRYVHEPNPGISAARNRGFDETSDRDAVVFIDDDERPVAGWLNLLIQTWVQTGADAVVGPVVSSFSSPLDPWVDAGRFFDRRRMSTGTPVTVAATNNLLLDLAAIRELGLRFDTEFGLSGGSDTLFTRTLALRGRLMVWCDEAVVTDVVPAHRATPAWVLHRALRSGNSSTRCDVALAPTKVARIGARLRGAGLGAARVIVGSAQTLGGWALRSLTDEARGRRTMNRGIGMMSGAFGKVVFDYARS